MSGYIQHDRVGLAMCRDQAEVLNTCLWLEIISYAWKIVKLHSIVRSSGVLHRFTAIILRLQHKLTKPLKPSRR